MATFLLIDDDEDDRELFELALQEADPQVTFIGAASGIIALKMLTSGEVKPDYIFLDLNMPQMNGRECLTEIMKKPELSHIPVIIFSTSSDPRDIEDTKALGAVNFISKPSKTSELTRILQNFIINQLHNT